jgi:Cysteine-rich secretory protein family
VRRSTIDRHPRALAAVVVFALLAFVGFVTTPVQASPENPAADEAQFVAQLNATRAKGGLAPLTVDPELQDLARGWAQQMADAGHISHANPISAGVTADWRKLGENVGTGGNVTVVMNAFIASPGHYANIMDPEFTKVGVGVVWVGNALYTTHRFMKLAGSPAPDPTTAPAPAVTTPPAPSGGPATPPAASAPVAPKRVATTTTTAAPPPTTTTAAPSPPPPARSTRVASVLGALIATAH